MANEAAKEPGPVILDWYLQALVSLVNRTECPFPITLNVRGALISGEMVSGKAYFGAVKEEFSSAFPEGETKAAIAEWYGQFQEIYREEPSGEAASEEEAASRLFPTFIHLRNARIFTAGQQPIPMNRGLWWRGRIESVDGFAHGSLATGPPR